MSSAERGWELPIRAFHWALAMLVVFSFTTGQLGGSWLEWHFRSGYAILTLLVFRLAWGFAGSREARFATFLRGPRSAIAYLRALASGERATHASHNPAGGWMVVVMLALLSLQAVTGLFSNDESAHEGPLAAKVSEALVDRMSTVHSWNEWAVVAAVVLHVVAVSVYQWRLRMDVIGRMTHGASSAAANLRAIAIVALAALAVYALVVVYPR